jgi:hypothetical protein
MTHTFDCTNDVPDEHWRAVPRDDRPCSCGGAIAHFWNEGAGRLLICHRGLDGVLLCALATHQTPPLDMIALPGQVVGIAHAHGGQA